jgi:3-hydroxybutyrate dehydrogenase
MLKDKTAIITGSTSGIGLAIARSLAKAGAHIVVNGLGDPVQIDKECQNLSALSGSKVVYDPADMTQPEEIAQMVHKTHQNWGRVDIIVNNAGIQFVSPVEDFPTEKWDAILAINLSSAFHTIRTAVPYMKSGGGGRIINLASAHALVASPYKSAYVAAKHGMAGLTKSIALEVAQHNITCNAICPGYVKTALVDNQITQTAQARGLSEDDVIKNVILGAQPTKKFTTVEQIGALCVFLCSDAADNITGTMIPIDGGWTAQ